MGGAREESARREGNLIFKREGVERIGFVVAGARGEDRSAAWQPREWK